MEELKMNKLILFVLLSWASISFAENPCKMISDFKGQYELSKDFCGTSLLDTKIDVQPDNLPNSTKYLILSGSERLEIETEKESSTICKRNDQWLNIQLCSKQRNCEPQNRFYNFERDTLYVTSKGCRYLYLKTGP